MIEHVRKGLAQKASGLGLARGWGLTLLGVLLFLAIFALPGAGEEEAAAGGTPKEMFLAQRCDLCHAIASEGVEKRSKGDSEKTNGPDLSAIEAPQSAEWIAAYLKKEEQLHGKEHQKTWKGSDADLARLAEWLAGLAAKPEA